MVGQSTVVGCNVKLLRSRQRNGVNMPQARGRALSEGRSEVVITSL